MNSNQQLQLKNALEAVKQREIKEVYFVACGGSKAIFEPIQYLFDLETSIPSAVYTANEFIHRSPKALGKNSLLVSCSHSGNTPETVKATAFAREKGALTISLSFKPGSELWEAAEYGLEYTWGPESNPSESNNGMLYRLAFGVLNVLDPKEKYQKGMDSVDILDKIIPINKKAWAQRADEYGSKYKRNDLIYTMSSGGCYGVAYSFAECLLMEMLWIHSQPIHSGEYFHGPFEITDYDVPFLIFLNSGETRPLDERALAFAVKYSNCVEAIDAKDFDMGDIPVDLQGYFAPVVMNAVTRLYADALSDHRGHPLSVRRYMWRMEY
ncbi:MAG: SIS domain-containing protein [Clostridiales bacterium]|nr:SIS domain-containing protein [Clostridiales bacterium]